MSIFDKMFKKNAFDEKMDQAYEDFVENNPVMKKARATIDEAANEITHSLEKELYGEKKEPSKKQSMLKGDADTIMQKWDSMIDHIVEKEFSAYKVCPSCGEAAPAELDRCPHCGTQLERIELK